MEFVPLKNILRVDAPEYVTGRDSTIGYIRKGCFALVVCVSLSEENLKTLFLKLREYNKFGVDIPVCENCGGTPAFPKFECVCYIHEKFDEN